MYELEQIKEKIQSVAKKYNLVYVWVFGSYTKKKLKNLEEVLVYGE